MRVIVPNVLRDAINEKLDLAYEGVPESAIDRELHYNALLRAYDELGYVPAFTLEKKL